MNLRRRADPTRLHQVLFNLLSNASKYNRAGGCISISTSRSNDRLVFRAADSGIGIEQHRLKSVFDLFSRGEHGQEVGLRIGLALVKTLVELHGGTVRAYSGGPGLGSTFEVLLPGGQDPTVSDACDDD